MRKSLIVAFVLAGLLASSGSAAGTRSLSIHVSSTRVLYGGGVTLSGRLSNGLAHQSIAVIATPYGRRAMRVATVTTGPTGAWTVSVRPTVDTTYTARLLPTISAPLTVGVEPAIATHTLASGRVWAHVAAGRSMRGRLLELQQVSGSGWRTIGTASIGRGSVAVFAAPLARGAATMRVALSVNQAGAGYLGSTSHAFVYHARFVTLAPSTATPIFGVGLKLSGRISSGLAGQVVTILAHPYASSLTHSFRVRTTGGGRWSLGVAPTIQTAYSARWGATTSTTVVVGVRPALAVSRLSSGLIHVRVRPVRRFVGRNVELQRRMAAGWRTIEVAALAGPLGSATFSTPPAAGVPLRVAMSINAAGKGFLGTHTPVLVFGAHTVSLVPSGFRVLYGHAILLAGSVSSGQAGQRVEILAQPYGASAPHVAATVVTGSHGAWRLHVYPKVRTSYTARWGTSTSAARVIGVQPRVAVMVVANHRVHAQVIAPRALRGRLLQLQQLMPSGAWVTVAWVHLGAGSTAVFPARNGSATLRVALSVNEAGAGLLGGKSKPFLYTGS